MSVINYYFREKGKAFSIEKIFEELAESIESGSGTVKRLYCPFPGGRNLINVFRNGLWARRNSTEVNHITGDAHYLALFLPRRGTVLTIHDCNMIRPLSGLSRFLVWFLWLYLPVRFAGTVTVISKKTKDDLCRLTSIDPSLVRVIPDFVSDDFQYSPKGSWPQVPRVLVLGTKKNKNLEGVIDALSGVGVCLRIVGKVTDSQRACLSRSELSWECAHDLSDVQILQEYEDADIVLFASLHEGFGMPIIEAQAIGRPLITSNRSPMRDVAGAGAMLVDPESHLEIRSAVLCLMSDPILREQICDEGRKNVQRFRMASIAKQYEELYSSARDGRP